MADPVIERTHLLLLRRLLRLLLLLLLLHLERLLEEVPRHRVVLHLNLLHHDNTTRGGECRTVRSLRPGHLRQRCPPRASRALPPLSPFPSQAPRAVHCGGGPSLTFIDGTTSRNLRAWSTEQTNTRTHEVRDPQRGGRRHRKIHACSGHGVPSKHE